MATMIELTCKFCDQKFIVKMGREKIFCSKECKLNNRAKNDQIYYIEKFCEYCGKNFKSKKKEEKKFCSYKCAGLDKKRKSRENRTCLECGNLFIERIKYKKSFCSKICRIKWQTKPENIIFRLKRTKEGIFKKYGVENIFKVDEIKTRMILGLRKTYKERGAEIMKNNFINHKINKENVLKKRFSNIGYTILEFNDDEIKVLHPDGHIFINNRKLLVNRLNHNVELSTILQPIGSPRTTFELKISKFLKENNINHITNDRKTINGEIDIYIPDYNIGIEINGLHWHCEYYLDNDYHLQKTNKCDEKNIQLFHFFEDELIEKFDIVKSIIKSKLGIIENKILPCKCIIKEINSITSNNFLEINHLQGNINSKIRIGLFYNDELVSVMIFKKKCITMHNKTNLGNEYEMLRFCNKLNTEVIGGASKLYSYFKKKYLPQSVVSFADKRYSNGNLYKKLGFKLLKNTLPNYFYVVGKTRKNKFLFRKNILIKDGYDVNKTEHQIMLKRKIPRIYDCGNIKCVDHILY